MPIEVTSVSDPRTLSFPKFSGVLKSRVRNTTARPRYLIAKLVIGLCLVSLCAGGLSVLRSYSFYSSIIDARLASGYLTSRPGLYAAPRVLQVGQKLSQDNLITVLR